MSESGSGSGSGRRGFVRDVMKRISTSRVSEGEDVPTREELDDLQALQDALRLMGPESADVVRRVERLIMEFELLRQRYDRGRQQLYDAERQNEKLVNTLQDAKQQIDLLKEEVDKLCAPPNTYGVFERLNKDGTVEINVDGKMMRVNLHPTIRGDELMDFQEELTGSIAIPLYLVLDPRTEKVLAGPVGGVVSVGGFSKFLDEALARAPGDGSVRVGRLEER